MIHKRIKITVLESSLETIFVEESAKLSSTDTIKTTTSVKTTDKKDIFPNPREQVNKLLPTSIMTFLIVIVVNKVRE